ncbi:hypothetical protein VCHC51A1_2022, partial [Vibrio cholerae HC-51A1]
MPHFSSRLAVSVFTAG